MRTNCSRLGLSGRLLFALASLTLNIALRHAGRAAHPCAVPKSSEIFAILERPAKAT
jgi:hypothetical protein